MGLGGISIWQLLIILAIVVMLFGTSRLRNIGSDLGSAIRGFRDSMSKDDASGESDGTNAARKEQDSDKPTG
jgi:sec-independent protein translocase protein TatA